MTEQTPPAVPRPTVTIRRPTADRFRPRPVSAASEQDVVVERNLLRSARRDSKPQTSRERLVVGDLPDWEPQPPGELTVRRSV